MEKEAVLHYGYRMNCMDNAVLKFFINELTLVEFRSLMTLVTLSRKLTNAIPLHDGLAEAQKAKRLGIHRGQATEVLAKLKSLGVYKQVVSSDYEDNETYWILNPYVSYKGIFDLKIAEKFHDTEVYRVFLANKQ